MPQSVGASTDIDWQELIDQLLLHFCKSRYTARGVPMRQLGSVCACERVCVRFLRLDELSPEELAAEHRSLDLPGPAGAHRRAYLEDLRQHAVWADMPLAALRWVCQELSSTSLRESEDVAQRELVQRLLLVARTRRHEEHGVPMRRLEPGAAAQLLERFLAVEAMPRDGHVEECLRCGLLPLLSSGDRALLLRRLKWALAAQEFPFVELPCCRNRKQLCTLELPDNAGVDDVNTAYKKLALKYHPGKRLSSANENSRAHFQEMAASYEAMTKHCR